MMNACLIRQLTWLAATIAAIATAGACRPVEENRPSPRAQESQAAQRQPAAPPSAPQSLPASETKRAGPAVDSPAAVTTPVTTPPPPGAGDHPAQSLPDRPKEDDAEEDSSANDSPDSATPLVDDPRQLQRLHPKYPAWITKDRKSVVVVGQICQREAPLELFACKRGSKEHESVVSLDVDAYVLHAGLLVTGAEPGHPVQFYPKFLPAQGPEVEITARWKDEKDALQETRAQDWVRQTKNGKAMEYPWIFAGSRFVKNEETGAQRYMADMEGDLICVSNFPDAVLDLPVESTSANDALAFDAFTDHIPPLGTPVTLVLTPRK